jgi:hypothetical protein
MCTPWKPGIAIYIMVIAQIAVVLANCFAGCIKPEVGATTQAWLSIGSVTHWHAWLWQHPSGFFERARFVMVGHCE